MYLQFDNNGMPTHDENNEPLSKKKLKKLPKLLNQHKKDYQQYQENIKQDSNFIQNMLNELNDTKQKLKDLESQ